MAFKRSYPTQYALIPGYKPAEVVEKLYKGNKLVLLKVRWSNLDPHHVKTVKYHSGIKFTTRAPWYKRKYRKVMKYLKNLFNPLPETINEGE